MTDGQELARALRAAYWAMHRRTNEALAAHGVTADQFVLLSRLADQDAITQQELARRADSDANTIRPMLLLLEKRGLITRRPHPSDGRAHRVLLTAQGRRQFTAMMASTERCRRKMLSGVKHCSPKAIGQNLRQIALMLERSGKALSKVKLGIELQLASPVEIVLTTRNVRIFPGFPHDDLSMS